MILYGQQHTRRPIQLGEWREPSRSTAWSRQQHLE